MPSQSPQIAAGAAGAVPAGLPPSHGGWAPVWHFLAFARDSCENSGCETSVPMIFRPTPTGPRFLPAFPDFPPPQPASARGGGRNSAAAGQIAFSTAGNLCPGGDFPLPAIYPATGLPTAPPTAAGTQSFPLHTPRNYAQPRVNPRDCPA